MEKEIKKITESLSYAYVNHYQYILSVQVYKVCILV